MPLDRPRDPSRTPSNGRPRAGACALRLVFSAAPDTMPAKSPAAGGDGTALSLLAWRLCEAQVQWCFALWVLPLPFALRPVRVDAGAGREPKDGPHLRRVK